MILKDDEGEIDTNKLLKLIWDADKLTVDAHHKLSESRRAFIFPIVGKKKKPILEGTKVDKYLFSENLGDSMKVAEALEKAGKNLLPQKPSSNKEHLNGSGPSRSLPNQSRGGRRTYGSLKSFKTFQRFRHPRSYPARPQNSKPKKDSNRSHKNKK